ncbi:MAG: hypothetical protein IJ730_02020 [Alphaproteobacteria bacterium]|nr:hypothetical protein [Alphaproteobacteria bacterium]
MNFLRKILLIAIISVFAGNAEEMLAAQAVFDLPKNTPGLMKDKRQRKICEQYKDCVHIIVPGTEAHKTFLLGNSSDDECGAIESALYKSGNIYFPADGTQPTTEEAVEYSCANIADDNITDWYIRVFGGDTGVELSHGYTVPTSDLAPQMSFAADGSSAHIITVNTTGAPANFCKDFWQIFRIIASDPVGRILLYRLLIEIRRFNHNGKGCFGTDVKSQANIQIRNASRSIVISFNDSNSFKETTVKKESIKLLATNVSFDEQAHINFSVSARKTIVIGPKTDDSYFLNKEERSNDIALFHEMGHWYHFLRDTDRLANENINPNNKLEKLIENSIGKYFYDNLEGINEKDRIKISAESWCKFSKFGQLITYEEMKNILGIPIDLSDYKNGDDLCENLYRISRQTYIRFSHSDDPYFEDQKVIERATNILQCLIPSVSFRYIRYQR